MNRFEMADHLPDPREGDDRPLIPQPTIDLRYGAEGYRDPENPCDAFVPTENIDHLGLRVTSPGTGDCHSDGHYLCKGCTRLGKDAFDLEEEEEAFYSYFERGSNPLREKVPLPPEALTRFQRKEPF